jgi:hypothetical protein
MAMTTSKGNAITTQVDAGPLLAAGLLVGDDSEGCIERLIAVERISRNRFALFIRSE